MYAVGGDEKEANYSRSLNLTLLRLLLLLVLVGHDTPAIPMSAVFRPIPQRRQQRHLRALDLTLFGLLLLLVLVGDDSPASTEVSDPEVIPTTATHNTYEP